MPADRRDCRGFFSASSRQRKIILWRPPAGRASVEHARLDLAHLNWAGGRDRVRDGTANPVKHSLLGHVVWVQGAHDRVLAAAQGPMAAQYRVPNFDPL